MYNKMTEEKAADIPNPWRGTLCTLRVTKRGHVQNMQVN